MQPPYPRSARVSKSPSGRAGYTLVELMITVAIIGILAAISIPSYMSYLYRSKTSEAVGFLADIKSRQEAYRSEYFQYCNVSASLTAFYPATQTSAAQPWGATPTGNWTALGVSPPNPSVYFGYAVIAGVPGDGNGDKAARGYNESNFWFISNARADLDGDGNYLFIESLSARQSLWFSEAKGWE